jgi:hypothetical protein
MNRIHISFIRSILDANNIKYQIESENFIRVPAIIRVDKAQLKMAEELLKDFKEGSGKT